MKMILEEGRYRFNFKFFGNYPKNLAGEVIIFGEVFHKYKRPQILI